MNRKHRMRTCIFIPDKSAKAVSSAISLAVKMSALHLRRASIKLVNSFLSSFERPQGIEGDGFRCLNIHQSIRLVVTLFRTSNSCLI